MSKRIFIAAFLMAMSFSFSAQARDSHDCDKQTNKARVKIKKSFDKLWENVESAVGVEFFMVVLQSNERMPSSELTDAEYFQHLLKGMKRTSKELADQGLKFDEKRVKSLEDQIQDFARQSFCKEKNTLQVTKN